MYFKCQFIRIFKIFLLQSVMIFVTIKNATVTQQICCEQFLPSVPKVHEAENIIREREKEKERENCFAF